MLPYVEEIDVERIHVREPFDVVLVCGGQCGNIGEAIPKSLRDAFLKIFPNPSLKDRELIQAEDITRSSEFFEVYSDLLIFETDLAQIVDLIILFCESEGSLAELGAFAATDEIMKRLFVVVRDRHWVQDSFIKLGPLRRIEQKIGREAIYVLADEDVGLEGHSAERVDKQKLLDLLQGPLERRLATVREPVTFDRNRAGHIIKLIVGLVQEYGALTVGEISNLLHKFGISIIDNQIKGYLHCSKAVGWLTVISKGANDYYVETKFSRDTGRDAAALEMKKGSMVSNKIRRRSDIREYWMDKDRLRFSVIQQAGKGG